MRKRIATGVAFGAISATLLLGVSPAGAHGSHGSMRFEPIEGTPYDQATADWKKPFVIPEGYEQRLIADETVLDIYPGEDDLTDMNTVNETGKDAGRYLYRTHETGANGSLSVVDLKTGKAEVLVQRADWNRLDGLRWTPWGTILFAEETAGGRLFEAFLSKRNPMKVTKVIERTEVGVMRHEGIEALEDGTVFVIDELNGGSIYKFEPKRGHNLSDGQLYALKLTGLTDEQQVYSDATYDDKVGKFKWVKLDMDAVVADTDAASNAKHATEFGRPEDIEVIGSTLYVANTTEDRVVAINLKKQVLSSFVQAGVNVPVENADAGVTGFNNPDNLAQGHDGSLWIAEDNYLSDVWVADRKTNRQGASKSVEQFTSIKDTGAEISGIYFGKDPNTLFLNIQHPDKPLADGTWVITRR